MSKVSYEPNNTKNGHLGAKLEPIENRKFPKNRFHTPTTRSAKSQMVKLPLLEICRSIIASLRRCRQFFYEDPRGGKMEFP